MADFLRCSRIFPTLPTLLTCLLLAPAAPAAPRQYTQVPIECVKYLNLSPKALARLTPRPSAPPSPNTLPAVYAARIVTTDTGTRLSFDFPANSQYQVFTLSNPERIVVDIDGRALSPALQRLPGKLPADDPLIAAVRIGRVDSTRVRTVLDLKAAAPTLQTSTEPLPEHAAQRLVVQWSASAP